MNVNNLQTIKTLNNSVSKLHQYINNDAKQYSKYPNLKDAKHSFNKAYLLTYDNYRCFNSHQYKVALSNINKIKNDVKTGEMHLFYSSYKTNYEPIVPKKYLNKYNRPLKTLSNAIPNAKLSIHTYTKYIANQPSLDKQAKQSQAKLDKYIPKQLSNLRERAHAVNNRYYKFIKQITNRGISSKRPRFESITTKHHNVLNDLKYNQDNLNVIKHVANDFKTHNPRQLHYDIDAVRTANDILNSTNFGTQHVPFDNVDAYADKMSKHQKLSYVNNIANHKHISLTTYLKSWNRLNDAHVSYNPQTLVHNSHAKTSQVKIPYTDTTVVSNKIKHVGTKLSKVPSQVYVVSQLNHTKLNQAVTYNITDLTKPNHSIWLKVHTKLNLYNDKAIQSALTSLKNHESLSTNKYVSLVHPNSKSPLVKLSNKFSHEPINARQYNQYIKSNLKRDTQQSKHLINNYRRATMPITYGGTNDSLAGDANYVKSQAKAINQDVNKIANIQSGLNYNKPFMQSPALSYHKTPKLKHQVAWQHTSKRVPRINRKQSNIIKPSHNQARQLKRKQSGLQR